MNEWISKHARKGFTWTSIAVNRDAKSLLHADSSNLKGSENFAVSFRDFKGGWLWIEGTDGQGPATQTKGNGTVVAGGSHNTKDSPLYFAPHLHHCVLPWTGTRFGLIAFTSSQASAKAPDCKVADLENLLPLVDRAFTASNYLSIAWLYAGGEPQAALSVALGDGGQGYKALPTIAKVSDEGLGRLQPGDNRGRERGVIIVSDSTLIFKAGARIFAEIFQALGTFSNSMARQAESHVGRQPPQPRGS
eukprot:s1199_g3.t1